MQKILSNLLTFCVAGLVIMTFLYVASVVIPILLLVIIGFVCWFKFKESKTIRQWGIYEKNHKEQKAENNIIDVEYEVIDDNKR